MITVIMLYRRRDAEIMVQVVEGRLTADQRQAWRTAHNADTANDDPDNDSEDLNDMFFRELDQPVPNGQTADLFNADGDSYGGTPAAE